MARSKSWTEGQQPENQYTHGQYWFNVSAMLFFAIALVAVAIWLILPPPKATTAVFWLGSNRGAELRGIPFQDNDLKQLMSAFESGQVQELERFDDKPSFDQIWKRLRADAKSENPTTAIIVCSAIGSVENSKPVLKPTTAQGESILVEQFLNEFVTVIDAERYIVIFDCGHNYSRPLQLFAASPFNEGDDFNLFSSHVHELVSNMDPMEKPLAVVTSSLDGEIPLYSLNERRTLFGLAIQDSLSRNHKTVDDFCESLQTFCLEHGGEAAQTPTVSKSKRYRESELGIMKLNLLANDEGKNEGEGDTDVAPPTQNAKTTSELKKIAGVWRDRDSVLRRYVDPKPLLTPADIDTKEWETRIAEIAELSAGIRNSDSSFSSNIGELGLEASLQNAERITAQFPGLFSAIPADELANAVENSVVDPQSKQRIASAFLIYHRAVLKTKFHLAIFESISWLDQSNSLTQYESAIAKLKMSLLAMKKLFSDATAKESELDAYIEAEKEVALKLDAVKYRLEKLCESIGREKHGFTREMALMNLLDSPLIKAGNPDPDSVSEPHDREGLMLAFQKRVDGFGDRFAIEQRKANSMRRWKMFDGLDALVTRPNEDVIRSRKQDSIAYYLRTGKSKLPELRIDPRPTVFAVNLRDKAELFRPKQLELNETEIDLGLVVTPSNSRVAKPRIDLICEPGPNAPFEILNGTVDGNKVRIENSDGKIRIQATKNAFQVGADKSQFLTVSVENIENQFAVNNVQSIKIPLALPGEDRVELGLTLSGTRVSGSALRPWPNQPQILKMSLQNFFHGKKNVRATIFPCRSLEGHAIMPGNIDEAIKKATLDNLSQIPALAICPQMQLEEATPDVPSEPQTIVWAAETDLRVMDANQPIAQGILCRIEEVTNEGVVTKKLDDVWIPLFPETKNCFDSLGLALDPNSGGVLVSFAKSDSCKNQAISLSCRLGGQLMGRIKIPANKLAGTETIVSDLGPFQRELQSEQATGLVHIDVNGWPRRNSYIYRDGQFLDALTHTDSRFPNIAFDVETKADALVKLKSFDSDSETVKRILGYNKKNGTLSVDGKLRITCNTQDNFRFPGSNDCTEIRFGDRTEKYYFPREVASNLTVNPNDSTMLNIQSNVDDFSLKLDINMDRYDIDPQAFIFANLEKKRSGKDITRILFDNRSPTKPSAQLESEEFELGKLVKLKIGPFRDQPGGVGVDRMKLANRLKYKIEPKANVLIDESKSVIAIKAEKPGEYQLKLQAYDRLGNLSEPTTKVFRITKPEPKKAPPKKKTPPTVTHVLKVVVFVGPTRLQEGQEPELVIAPDDGVKMTRTGSDSYKFTGLKSGETYVVAGKFKMTSGLKLETSGKTKPFSIKENATTRVTTTRKLNLEN